MINTVDHVRDVALFQSKGAGGEEQDGVERGEGLGSEEQERQERDGVAADLEFQRELEVWNFPAYIMSV